MRRLARSCKQKRRISNSRPSASNDRPPSPSGQEVLEDPLPPLYSPKYPEEEFSELRLEGA